MTGVAALVAMNLTLAMPTHYAEARAEAVKSGEPIVVLVGTDWCPGCREMKNRVTPEIARRGGFENVQFTVVDADKQPKLARQLMSGGSIPQLVMFRKTEGGWKRSRIIGAQNIGTVERFIQRGVRDFLARRRG